MNIRRLSTHHRDLGSFHVRVSTSPARWQELKLSDSKMEVTWMEMIRLTFFDEFSPGEIAEDTVIQFNDATYLIIHSNIFNSLNDFSLKMIWFLKYRIVSFHPPKLMQFTNATGFEKFIFSASEVCHKSRPQLSPCWGPYGIRKVGLTEQFSLGLLQRATIMIL